MTDDSKTGRRVKVECQHHIPIWLIGWLFTIGYVNLPFWKAVLALIIWPYYMGVAVR